MRGGRRLGKDKRVDRLEIFLDCLQAKFGGLTPLGTMLDRKILRPFVFGPAQSGSLRKPVLVITITDGEPQGEPTDAVRSVIKDAKKTLNATPYGPGAVAFEFAQASYLRTLRYFGHSHGNDTTYSGVK